MIRTLILKSKLAKEEADALNRASGEIYSRVCTTHWRAYRLSGKTWISAYGAEKLSDWQHKDSPSILHSHSIDAAQQAFYKAIKTARTNRKENNVQNARFPYKRKYYRTTSWKTSGIRLKQGKMLLSRASGLPPVIVDFQTKHEKSSISAQMEHFALSAQMEHFALSAQMEHFALSGEVREVRLVYDLKQRDYFWHIVVEDGIVPTPVVNGTTAAIDMGEIHPVAITDGTEVCIMSCRKLRSIAQGKNRNLAKLQAKLSHCQKNSRRAKRLKQAKKLMLAQFNRRQRNLLHKVSRETINWCKEKNVGILAIGNVRNVADKTKINHRIKGKETRQKLSGWAHGTLRKYLGYKAEEEGISVHDKVHEAYTSQTCPKCGHRYKPSTRNYKCTDKTCRFNFSRDGVGSVNILSRFVYNELARFVPQIQKYRHPYVEIHKGKRSLEDTQYVAI